jgi:hypothetical protein
MTTLVFFLEEESAKFLLESFLPKIIPDEYETQFIVFEGKSDLDKKLTLRLRRWCKPDCKFVVLRDQDNADCRIVKKDLREKCKNGNNEEALIRIACTELESWYFGDFDAIQSGLEIPSIQNYKNKAKYRKPDNIIKPSKELMKITKGKYQKRSGSREIGKYLSIEGNKSTSFNVFIQGIRNICDVELE